MIDFYLGSFTNIQFWSITEAANGSTLNLEKSSGRVLKGSKASKSDGARVIGQATFDEINCATAILLVDSSLFGSYDASDNRCESIHCQHTLDGNRFRRGHDHLAFTRT